MNSAATIDWSAFDAVLFDLDGVLTSTATIHAAAWKRTFDDFLASLHPGQAPFDDDEDYRLYVDGRPRYDGVATFLASRGIEVPRGNPTDAPGFDTVCAIGNRKNDLVQSLIASQGAEVYPDALDLVEFLGARRTPMAVVSASANAGPVLEAAGIADRFSTLVDGKVARRLGLAGKPQPDPFLEAAKRLEVAPARAVVIEDAVAGVAAGVAGGFGAVVGVDRHADPGPLGQAGATVVVPDLRRLLP